jgi:hypothetical protein
MSGDDSMTVRRWLARRIRYVRRHTVETADA